MNEQRPTTGGRLHALDALRGGALLLGLALHASMAFFLPVPAQDVSRSVALGVGFYVIHVFRMSLFFLLAGFFARLAVQRLGTRGFVKDRARRIGVPLVVGWLLLAPPIVLLLMIGYARSFPEGAPELAATPPQGFPLTHLWFLYYLGLFYVLALGLRAGLRHLDGNSRLRGGLDALLRQLVRWRLAPLLLAVPLAGWLYADAGWAPWFGIPTPDHGLVPQMAALLGFGVAFLFGWALHRQTDLLPLLARHWAFYLVIGSGLTVLCLGLVGLQPDLAAPTALAGGTGERALYALAYTVSVWCWSFGLLGAALRFCASPSPARRYLADASYWLYLSHLPVVFGLQVLMMHWPLHWSLKFPLILGLTLALLLPAYHFLVRPTALGALLNGRRYPRRTAATQQPANNDGSAATASPATAGRLASNHPEAGPAPLAELCAVGKHYGDHCALERLDLDVRPGELLALLGPNGAGKSTAIGLWLGLLQADRGTVRLFGAPPEEATSRLGIGVMMQEVALSPMLSARELITLTSAVYREPLSVEATVALAGIGEIAGRRYGSLSTGQKRQVQFALAVCGQPRLLFLDEPTVGLDVAAREAMWRSIRQLLDDGRAIVLTTHYLEEAEALADRVAVLAKGQLIAEGSVEAIRAVVSRAHIRCRSRIEAAEVRSWPGVVDAGESSQLLQVTADDAEAVVRRLLQADPLLSRLEVRPASLAEAFAQLTREAA